jgi:uncharacterized membrane protein YhaH (DUF805 family)
MVYERMGAGGSYTRSLIRDGPVRIYFMYGIRNRQYMNYYFDVLKKYTVFEGRARRKEYWMFFLCNIVVVAVIWLIGGFALHTPLLNILYSLAVLLPQIAVSIRRLHDTDHSGWWLLVGLIPLIGTISLLVFFVTDSSPGQNRFGPNPKGV